MDVLTQQFKGHHLLGTASARGGRVWIPKEVTMAGKFDLAPKDEHAADPKQAQKGRQGNARQAEEGVENRAAGKIEARRESRVITRVASRDDGQRQARSLWFRAS
jgi:hypothetical protein